MEEYWVIYEDENTFELDKVDSARTLEEAIISGLTGAYGYEIPNYFYVQSYSINRSFPTSDCHWKFNVIDGQAVKEYERPWEIFRTESDW